MLLPLTVSGQLRADSIVFTVKTANVGCNHSSLGTATITVTSTNTPYNYSWSNGQIGHYIIDLEAGVYTVKITDNLANDTTVTIEIHEFPCEMEPEIIFTPNGDGYNDTWAISNTEFFPDALILVYNRWGQKIYEHSGLYTEPWNGVDLFGISVPDATYYCVLYMDRNDRKGAKKTSVSILR